MRKPNYGFERSQRDLAKKAKKEAKTQKKLEQNPDDPEAGRTADQEEEPAAAGTPRPEAQ